MSSSTHLTLHNDTTAVGTIDDESSIDSLKPNGISERVGYNNSVVISSQPIVINSAPPASGSKSRNNCLTAIVMTVAVALLVVGLLIMDIHLSHTHHGHLSYMTGRKDEQYTVVKSTAIPNDNKEYQNGPLKIAYIFAGAARTLTCSSVHWSIKTNLIDALGEDPHVFVRVSLEDNRNIKTGDGVIHAPNYNQKAINESLKVLNPLVVEYYKLSTQIEEMKRYYPGEVHTVFRENDNRRYSMFFHRCRAYRLMLKYETDNKMRFDWVILARLDAAWIDPILPMRAYHNDRAWITETGYDRFNDQFMLIPRQFSDYVYDLNMKVRKGIYCLGGPDVERWKCNRTELVSRGVSEEKIASVLPYCCPDILKKDENTIGRSERIHYKHLEEGKIPLSMGRFPVALVRNYNGVCETDCFRIYAYHYKEYIFRFASIVYKYLMPHVWPDTIGRSVSSRDRMLCYVQKEQVYPWKPITATELHEENDTRYRLDYSKRLVDQLDRVHPSIMLNPKDTELWRIHPTWNVEGCLKFSFQTKQLLWEMCKGHSWSSNLNYDSTQLFFLYVVPQRRQADAVIVEPSYQTSHWFPETTYSTNVPNITKLMVLNTKPSEKGYVKGAKCLTATALKNYAPIEMRDCSADPLQSLLTVRTLMDGSHSLSTVGQLAFAANPKYCVARDDNGRHKDDSGNNLMFPKSNQIFVSHCIWAAQLHQNSFEFELIMS